MNRANFLLLIFYAALPGSLPAAPPDQPSFGDGVFVALEPMEGYHDPSHPTDQWFHECTLTVKGKEVILSKCPVSFYKGEKWYSASDGGFFTYQGTLSYVKDHWEIKMLLTDTAYVRRRIDKDGKTVPPKPETYPIERMKDGSLQLDKLSYQRSEDGAKKE